MMFKNYSLKSSVPVLLSVEKTHQKTWATNQNSQFLSKLPTALKLVLAICLLTTTTLFNSVMAQTPGAYKITSSTGTFNLLTGATAISVASNDDGLSAATNIGFTFNFGGNNFTQFKINTNGWITFDVSATATTNYSSLNGTVNNCIAVYSGDLNSAGNALSYVVTGTSGNQICKIEWKREYEFSSAEVPDTCSFQVWLYEGSNRIETRYGVFKFGTRTSSQSPQPQVGLKGTSTASAQVLALTTSWSSPTLTNLSSNTMPATTSVLPDNGRIYTFDPPAPCATPGNQPTNIVLSPASNDKINLSFTAASSAPSGYLVVRYPSGASVTDPVDGVNYAAGNSLGAGTIVELNSTTAYLITGLAAATTYDIYVYSADFLCSGNIKYLVSNPLKGTLTTNLLPSSADNYMFAHSTGASLDAMVGASSAIGASVDDTPSGSLNIGFNFAFEDIIYTNFYVSPDGWLKLGGTTVTSAFTNAISSTTISNSPLICPFWDDMATGVGGSVSYVVTGSAPNRILKVQWFVTVPRNTTANANSTFQVWLYETSNKIEFRYGNMGALTNSASVGIRGLALSPAKFISLTLPALSISKSVANDVIVVSPLAGNMYAFDVPKSCGTTPTAQPTSLTVSAVAGVSSQISGSFTAASGAPNAYLVVAYPAGASITNPVNGTYYFRGNALGAGTVVSFGSTTNFIAQDLKDTTTYDFYVYSANLCVGGGPLYLTSTPPKATGTTFALKVFLSTTNGGFWSSPETWQGGKVPFYSEVATIADGATVYIDVPILMKNVTIGQGNSGILTWTGTTNTINILNNVLIKQGGKLLPYTTGGTGQIINIGGNFTNDGYCNCAVASTQLNFNGSQVGGSMNQILDGTGTFEGDGTRGIIRSLFFQTTGSSTINTNQELITGSLAHTAGSLNTNGKLYIDNTSQVYGRQLNMQVASVGLTNMGVGYTNAPIVFGASASPWVASGTGSANTRYYSGSNVYLATTSGTFDASTSPSHNSGSATNGTVDLLWLGTLGTLGNPFQVTAVTLGTQYFYGNNLYVCTTAGTPSATAPPTHTSGLATSGTATFMYVGSAAKVSVNYNSTTQNVRSLTLTNAGSGYSSAPSLNFITNGGTVTTTAAATVVFFQQIAGPANSLTQKSGSSTISGGININSTQGASAMSGVGAISTTNGGVYYTVAPTVGFAGPPGINLVTNPGSGYTTTPTITVTGGTLVSGSALTTSNFTIVVNQGKVISVYLNTGTTACYSVPPSLSFSSGTATLAFPSGCWPAASATIGSNGQITNFTVTNPGFGYPAAPTVGIGTTSGSATGGTFATVATAPTCRIALYNLTYNNFTPSTSAVPATEGAEIPASRKLNTLTLGSPGLGAKFFNNLELFGTSPLTLTSGAIDMGGNNLLFSWNGYAGTTGSLTAHVKNGSMTIVTRGGGTTGSTLNFPFDATFGIFTGSGTAASGASVLTVTVSQLGAPSGGAIGKRTYRVVPNTGALYGTNPTVTLNWNAQDSLVSDQAGLYVAQSTSLTGSWTTRSITSGTVNAGLATTGSRTTATSTPGPISMTSDDYFAFVTTFTPPAPLNFDIKRTSGITYSSIISTGNTMGWTGTSTDEQVSPTVSIPSSTFTYQGQIVTGFNMSTNGFLKLVTAGSGAITSANLSNVFGASPVPYVIAPFWEDLSTNPNSSITAKLDSSTRYQIIGSTVGSRKIVAEWANFKAFSGNGGKLNFQVVMDESDNSISFNYGPMQGYNSTNDFTYSYSCGLGGLLANGFPLPGQVLAQQYENSDAFSNSFAHTTNIGANALRVLPESNSSIKFTPGTYAGFNIPSNTPPANDNTSGAIKLATVTSFPNHLGSMNYSTRFATPSSLSVCAGEADDDVWFTFKATQKTSIIRVYGSGGFLPRLQVLTSSFNTLGAPICVVAATTGSFVDANLSGLTPGQTYYIRVYHDLGGVQATGTANISAGGLVTSVTMTNSGSGYTASALGSITTARVRITGGGGKDATATAVLAGNTVSGISITNGGYGYTSAPTVSIESPAWGQTGEFAIFVYSKSENDDCATATNLTGLTTPGCNSGSNSMTDNTESATPSTQSAVCGNPDDDVWYKFTAVNANTKIKVGGTGAFDAAFQVFDGGVAPGSCGTLTSLQCVNSAGAGALDTAVISTSIGNTYYVRVYHSGTGSAVGETFTICVTSAVPSCVASPISLPNGGSQCPGTVNLSWPVVQTATGYDLYLDAGAGPATTKISSNQTATSFSLNLTAGTYSWRVVPQNIFGSATSCSDFTFAINPNPKAAFNYNDTCAGNTVTFTSTSSISTGSISTYKWNYGNGSTGSGSTSTHKYAVSGTSYNVKLTVTSNNGCKDSTSKTITILTPLTAGTIGSNQTQCFNLTPNLLTSSSAASGSLSPYVYQWQQSTDSVNYTDISGANSLTYQPGALTSSTFYRRQVKTQSGCGPVFSNVVKVTVKAVFNPGVISSNQSVCPKGTGSAITFASNPSGAFGGYTYQWQQSTDSTTWGNISGQTGTSFTPSNLTVKTYYRVQVSSGNCNNENTNFVRVTLYSPVAGGTIGSNQTVCAGTTPSQLTQISAPSGGPGTYTFQWQSSSDSINWNNISGATSQNFSPGVVSGLTYFQRLVSSTGCPSANTNGVKIRTLAKPNVVFNVTNHCYNDVMPLTNSSNISSGTLTYLWNFGDGTTSTSSVPNKTYTTSGAFNVNLKATSNLGCKDSVTKSVIVATTPTPAFTFTLKCQGDSAIFTDQTIYACSGSGLQWFWDFGDGTSSTLQNARHRYASAGTYNVKFRLSLSGGFKDSITKTVVFNIKSKPDFTASNTCFPSATTITNSSTNFSTLNWSFGDGSSSTTTASSFTKTYGSAANYNIKLVSTSSFGCKDSIVKTVSVFNKPTANFTTNNNCLGATTTFSNASSGAVSFNWRFGDGTTSTNVSPNKTYATSGTFNVRLAVTSVNGCIDSVIKAVTIFPNPTASFTANNVCKGFASTFTNTSTGASSYVWDFGNGNSSTQTSPTVTYPASGTFTVKLTATTSNGCSQSASSSYTVFASPTAAFTSNNVCIGTTINFSNGSSGASTYSWNFGDATTSSLTNPSKSYSASGNFNVKLVASTSNGCKDSVTKQVVIFAKPVVDFSATNRCLGNSINFSNLSSGATGFVWNFGDGKTSATTSPSYTYASSGTYNVKLIAENANGCKDSVSKSITVFSNPSVSFTAQPNPICRGGLMNFTNTSTNGTSFTWNFGNGKTSTLTSPTNIYTAEGNYNVKLVSINSNGCKDSTFRTVTVWPRPKASFSFNNGCATDNLGFTSNSVGAVGHSWTFGDATTSTQANPAKGYTGPGTYSVTLIVTSVNGCMDTTTSSVTVHPRAAVSFTNPTNFCAGNAANFTNTSTLSAGNMTFQWKFGDGNSSSLTSPSNTYANGGNYIVTLTATTDKGCVNTATGNVLVFAKPTANFNAKDVCQGTAMTFNNTSVGGTTWLWDFGDATTSTSASPTKTYTNAGTYTVKLTATNGNNCSDVYSMQVTVNPNPVASFTAADKCYGQAVNFTNTSTNANDVYWNFGDGNTSNSFNPSYNYPASGTYNVTLNVESNFGCTGSITKSVTVYAAPKVSFSVNDAGQCVNGNAFVFTDNSTIASGTMSRSWTLGDGGTSTASPVNKTYALSGNYNVKLVVTGPNGCKDSATDIAMVYPKPQAGFTSNNQIQCYNNHLFVFTDATTISSGTLTRTWDFGDGTTAGGVTVNKQYASTGSYTVKLSVTSENGCTDNTTKSVTVNPSPSAGFSINNATQCLNGNNFVFTNSTSGATGFSSSWKMGDGSTAATANASRTYATAGNYRVTLSVNTAGGCSDSAYYFVKVLANPAALTITGPSPAAMGSKQTYSVAYNAGSSYNWTATNGTVLSNGSSTIQVKWNITGATGSLSVTETATNGCIGAPASYNVSLYDAASVSSLHNNAFGVKLYPNPAKNQFSVEVSTGEMVNMVVYNQLGKVVLSDIVFNDRITITDHNLAAGIYTAKLSTSQGKSSILRFEIRN